MGPQTIATTIDDVKLNPDLPSNQFDPPAEVQALLTKK
jgi:outer membrane lipoprotein-sorting protein